MNLQVASACKQSGQMSASHSVTFLSAVQCHGGADRQSYQGSHHGHTQVVPGVPSSYRVPLGRTNRFFMFPSTVLLCPPPPPSPSSVVLGDAKIYCQHSRSNQVYLLKLRFVSAECRLMPAVLLELLDGCPELHGLHDVMLTREFLTALAGASLDTPELVLDVKPPPRDVKALPEPFDICDRSALTASEKYEAPALAYTTLYTSLFDAGLVGDKAMRFVVNSVTAGLTLTGTADQIGFLFLYQLLAGHISFRVVDTDNSQVVF